MAKPFLKYAGGKHQIIDRIKKTLPTGNRLIEPFVGAGSVFLNTSYPKYLLADNNANLINLFKMLKKEQDEFINYCVTFFGAKHNNEQVYFKNRGIFNSTADLRLKSALFLYLNRHSFNGLMRTNSNGEFNVSFGKYKNPYFPAAEMRYFATKAKTATIARADFLTTMRKARPGNVVYCDPPYVPLSKTANFTKYNATGFTLDDHQALAEAAKKLANKGVVVIISNHDTKFVQQTYKGAKIIRFTVQRYISCKATTRGKVGEILAVFK